LESTTGSAVRTVTVSPARNGVAGTKLTPLPSGCACSVPVCAPLREPVTVTAPACAAVTPRRLISVPRSAVLAPGDGNATTDVAAMAARTACIPLDPA
jgi:hypothetical protein